MTKDELKKIRALTSKYVLDLIDAEEAYLKAGYWEIVERKGLDTIWKNPRYTLNMSRNHAILVSKAEDQNIGIV
jgi:hypothetical protein